VFIVRFELNQSVDIIEVIFFFKALNV